MVSGLFVTEFFNRISLPFSTVSATIWRVLRRDISIAVCVDRFEKLGSMSVTFCSNSGAQNTHKAGHHKAKVCSLHCKGETCFALECRWDTVMNPCLNTSDLSERRMNLPYSWWEVAQNKSLDANNRRISEPQELMVTARWHSKKHPVSGRKFLPQWFIDPRCHRYKMPAVSTLKSVMQ